MEITIEWSGERALNGTGMYSAIRFTIERRDSLSVFFETVGVGKTYSIWDMIALAIGLSHA